MIEECILNDKELEKYLEELKACFLVYFYKVKRKHLNLIYDYIRFYKCEYLGDSQGSFNYIFKDFELLSILDLDDYKDLEKFYSFGGIHLFIQIKLLDIESSVLRYKLSFMKSGTLF